MPKTGILWLPLWLIFSLSWPEGRDEASGAGTELEELRNLETRPLVQEQEIGVTQVFGSVDQDSGKDNDGSQLEVGQEAEEAETVRLQHGQGFSGHLDPMI